MIHPETNLDVADNSGARRVQCIKVLGGSKRKTASVGDIIVVSVKEAIPRAKVKKGEVHRAVIVRTAYPVRRGDGSAIRFDNNAAVLINKQGEPIGTVAALDLGIKAATPRHLAARGLRVHATALVEGDDHRRGRRLPRLDLVVVHAEPGRDVRMPAGDRRGALEVPARHDVRVDVVVDEGGDGEELVGQGRLVVHRREDLLEGLPSGGDGTPRAAAHQDP